MLSSSWRLPNHEYPIPQREPLIRIIRNRRVHRGMSNRNASRRRSHPPNMLIRLVPHLDAKGEVAGDVVEVRISKLAQKFIDAEVRLRACAPYSLRCFAQLLRHAQRVQLTIRLVHENRMIAAAAWADALWCTACGVSKTVKLINPDLAQRRDRGVAPHFSQQLQTLGSTKSTRGVRLSVILGTDGFSIRSP